MNPTNHNPDLSRSLAQHADQFARRGGSELEIDQVLARAGEIRRGRRMRATLVMAAVVAAIVVPVGIVSVGTDGTNGKDRPDPAEQVRIDDSPLLLDGLKTGGKPKVGWFQGTVWHGPDGREYELSQADVTAVAAVGDALLVATADPQGQRANLVPPLSETAQPVTSWPMEGGFAVSDGGNAAAFVQPNGKPIVVQSEPEDTIALKQIPRGTGFSATVLIGENCELPPEGAGCGLWVDSKGEEPETWVSGTDYLGHPETPLQSANLSAEHAQVAGITEVHDDLTTCSASYVGDEKTPVWTTCDHRALGFSPDGERLLASTSYADGVGDRQLAILDSDTGKATLELEAADDGTISQMVWEDDTHVLATVHEKGRWAILRIGLDGSREYAVAPVTGFEDFESPFVLPTR